MDVLIVDDSLVFRHALSAALDREPVVRIVGSVRNGKKALEFLEKTQVDLVTLDMEMPEMDGLATLAAIAELNASRDPAQQIGVVVVSSYTVAGAELTLKALEAGAFDFVSKPESRSEAEGIDLLHQMLGPIIQAYAGTRRPRSPAPAGPTAPAMPTRVPSGFVTVGTSAAAEVLCIGVSTGGPRALAELLPELCRVTQLPILIVQHMPAGFTASLAESLDRRCVTAQVREAVDGELLKPASVYIAPGGRHLMLSRSPEGLLARLSEGPPENGCRPSVDVLFRSAASACHGRVIAVVLTGMGSDGERSLRTLKREGARIIAQDEATSVVWGMPGSAVASGCVDKVAPLMGIPAVIARMLAVG